MDLSEFFQQPLFNLFGQEITIGRLSMALLTIIGILGLSWLILGKLLPRYFEREKVKTSNRTKVSRSIRFILYLVGLIGILWSLQLDAILYENTEITIRISTILEALLILQLANTLDWIFSKVIVYNYYTLRQEEGEEEGVVETSERPAGRLVQYAVYAIAIILILNNFELDYVLFHFERIDFKISSIIYGILIFILAQLVVWVLVNLILFNYYRHKKVDAGSRYAFSQLLKYIIYVIAAFMILESLGIQMTVIWGGAAALLVGVGLGLQQTFNDLLSGILLLFERTVEVGDMVQMDGLIGTVRKIGLRTSLVETNDNVAVIVPNSQLVTDKVINWSHADDKVRFRVDIGVAYGSDTELVKNLLVKVAKENPYVMDKPRPTVRFVGFGDSSLDFQLLFWSRNFLVIEDIKSDLRFAVDKAFRENNVEIPFPQRDVWIRKSGE